MHLDLLIKRNTGSIKCYIMVRPTLIWSVLARIGECVFCIIQYSGCDNSFLQVYPSIIMATFQGLLLSDRTWRWRQQANLKPWYTSIRLSPYMSLMMVIFMIIDVQTSSLTQVIIYRKNLVVNNGYYPHTSCIFTTGYPK